MATLIAILTVLKTGTEVINLPAPTAVVAVIDSHIDFRFSIEDSNYSSIYIFLSSDVRVLTGYVPA
jgi:hypothetical protein